MYVFYLIFYLNVLLGPRSFYYDHYNIRFFLHLALNTCHDKVFQSFLTIPDIEQKQVCRKLNPYLTRLVAANEI